MADNVLTLLEGLGQTADEVAAFLEGQGCKGERRSASRCPVANYLRRNGVYVRGVCAAYASVTYRPDLVPQPSAVSVFIQRFDLGKYPRLEC